MKRLLLSALAGLFLGCEDHSGSLKGEETRSEWEGYSEHEKIFECMFSRDLDQFPASIAPTEDYALIIYGDRESANETPRIAAILGSKDQRRIERAMGLKAIEELFATIKPGSSIRSYLTCTAPLTYDVPEEVIDRAHSLIPDGLIWWGEIEENLICTCPKQ